MFKNWLQRKIHSKLTHKKLPRLPGLFKTIPQWGIKQLNNCSSIRLERVSSALVILEHQNHRSKHICTINSCIFPPCSPKVDWDSIGYDKYLYYKRCPENCKLQEIHNPPHQSRQSLLHCQITSHNFEKHNLCPNIPTDVKSWRNGDGLAMYLFDHSTLL